ncbi:MAG: hypothetical protein CVU71_02145 [Deltaproteobacteria bacterium HGW-Deltaproteobacteria-6]|jgi:MSHA pilin protein MshA|nr:MAG: hypothetical protein CVU71_02145 [Deltaproteobacteria bacterium HGW-Deltaproteobacteria-6]
MKHNKSEQGFTLIEVISVLVILGILMAFAIPRYVSLIEYAKVKAIESALGSARSNIAMAYTKEILSKGSPPGMASLCEILNKESSGYTKFGDFTVEYTAIGNTGVRARVTGSSAFEMPAEGAPFEKTITLAPDE